MWPKEPRVFIWEPDFPGEGIFWGGGAFRPTVKYTGDSRRQVKLFATWQQRRGLLLSVQQTLERFVHGISFSRSRFQPYDCVIAHFVA